jgi:hypothetical protein
MCKALAGTKMPINKLKPGIEVWYGYKLELKYIQTQLNYIAEKKAI